jgi:hypothetical protein
VTGYVSKMWPERWAREMYDPWQRREARSMWTTTALLYRSVARGGEPWAGEASYRSMGMKRASGKPKLTSYQSVMAGLRHLHKHGVRVSPDKVRDMFGEAGIELESPALRPAGLFDWSPPPWPTTTGMADLAENIRAALEAGHRSVGPLPPGLRRDDFPVKTAPSREPGEVRVEHPPEDLWMVDFIAPDESHVSFKIYGHRLDTRTRTIEIDVDYDVFEQLDSKLDELGGNDGEA